MWAVTRAPGTTGTWNGSLAHLTQWQALHQLSIIPGVQTALAPVVLTQELGRCGSSDVPAEPGTHRLWEGQEKPGIHPSTCFAPTNKLPRGKRNPEARSVSYESSRIQKLSLHFFNPMHPNQAWQAWQPPEISTAGCTAEMWALGIYRINQPDFTSLRGTPGTHNVQVVHPLRHRNAVYFDV